MTAYEMRISDWSSDVCSSDLHRIIAHKHIALPSDAAYGQSNCALGSLFSQPADGNVKTAGDLAAVRIVRRSLAQAGQRLLRVAEELGHYFPFRVVRLQSGSIRGNHYPAIFLQGPFVDRDNPP